MNEGKARSEAGPRVFAAGWPNVLAAGLVFWSTWWCVGARLMTNRAPAQTSEEVWGCKTDQVLAQTSDVEVWRCLIGALAVLSFGVLVLLGHVLIDVLRDKESRRRAVGGIVATGVLLFAPLVMSLLTPSDLYKNIGKLIRKTTGVAPVAACVVAVVSLLPVGIIFGRHRDLLNARKGEGRTKRKIADFRECVKDIQWAFALLSAMLVLSTFCTAALWKALRNQCPTIPVTDELVNTYGLYFTALLCVVYTPTYLVIQNEGRTLTDEVYPEDDKTPLEKNLKNRETLAASIGLTRKNVLQGLLAAFAPIIAAIISGKMEALK
jgi:hypothetical protein